MSIRERIKKLFSINTETDPAAGYDLWSGSYDQQPGNLMLDLDEAIFSTLLGDVTTRGKTVVDVGCGTGRHWNKLFMQEPAKIYGYDVSAGMLEKLKQKFPQATVERTPGELLPGLADHSCDLLISTLTIAHIADLAIAINEWDRVLKKNAALIITDYHPVALQKGARRTFQHEGKTIAVKNHIYPLPELRKILGQRGFREIRFIEKKIDGSVRAYYEKQNALALFEKFKDVPVIFGLSLNR